jgi:hypothetical protein
MEWWMVSALRHPDSSWIVSETEQVTTVTGGSTGSSSLFGGVSGVRAGDAQGSSGW